MKNYLLLSACAILLVACNNSGSTDNQILINQVGFAPHQEKTATIDVGSSNAAPCNVYILDNASLDTVWQGIASATMVNPVSGKFRQLVDFSDLTTEGQYTLHVQFNDSGASPRTCEENGTTENIGVVEFTICSHPYRELTRKALRAFYYQRASMPIEEPFAEGYARPAGHPDDQVLVHASAATDNRPEGTILDCHGGWYDAGDYNKYVVNSGFTMGVWLMAYEMNKAYFDTLTLNIPESKINSDSGAPSRKCGVINDCPDMLAEAMYNIRWMLTMQDTDGGVYHKLTEPDFEGFIRPDQCSKQRYVVMKTTAAALDFAATMALAARVYAPYESVYPTFCAHAKQAAEKAYAWALANPEVYYDQPKMNEQFRPAITTGAYDDFDVQDEFYWAATELFLLTGDEAYRQMAIDKYPERYAPASWGNVAELASIEWILHSEGVETFAENCKNRMFASLHQYLNEATTISVYRCPYGNSEEEFFWGCNSEGCCWRGVECIYAYHLTGDELYRVNALRCLNYILGQNSTGYCYVTGFGSKPTAHPHHRLSYSHPKGTHPGFLAGGPNRMRQDAVTDGVRYQKNVPADESYLDEQPSYASNEVTINWNVTLFALTAGLDALE